ncbi:MAG: nucleotidyl transferase AbiEii/AbiGii toxin family protein [Deltaproteobacteria bacterium]|nr:nucleotidyl transferase AbiEii/AbiGii toxin family protein [Deltaproteobacteria bacterium]
MYFAVVLASVPKKYERAQKYHVDLGVGDAVHPEARKVETPSISQEHTPLSWSVYPIETIISEKLHAVINLGSGNSRSKDIYDLSLLLPKADPALLPESLKRTFANRKTILPRDLMATLRNIDLQMIRRGWPSATAPIANAPTLDKAWGIIIQKVEELL